MGVLMLASTLGSMGLVHHLEITVKGDGSANQDNSVQMCPDKSATMFQQLSVNKFKTKSALKCPEQFVMKLRTMLRPNVSWFTRKFLSESQEKCQRPSVEMKEVLGEFLEEMEVLEEMLVLD